MKVNTQIFPFKINHRPIIFNIGLWLFSFFLLVIFFAKDGIKSIDILYSVSFLITLIIPQLINFYVLIPAVLKKEKYAIYLILFIVLTFLFSQLNLFFFQNLIDYIFPNYYFISYHTNEEIFIIFFVYLVLTTFVKLTEEWIFFNKHKNDILSQEKQLIQEKLHSLRSQINPHFLFNSLNTIYAMALDNDKNITKSIVQLSDILRYVIYDTNTTKVKISKEIELIENYLSFQKSRLNNESFKITFEKNILNPNFEIYPMLLLPLIENAFKHGLSKSLNGFLSIKIEQDNTEFNFRIENSFEKNQIDKKGVGLENIQKNLDIIYPNNHSFIIESNKNTFIVKLKILQNAIN